ncbi:MAG: restriction endonuclease subunit S, partial [Clostridiaceae bacterium]|nr:restriction endonuclease subunit S [Clostridiaceae bacterium]
MNAQQLKNSILQLAVQGKLVPQNNNDEPASELIKRIKLEKEKLVKEKKIKADKNPSEIFRGSDNLPYEKVGKETRCIADEVPFEIPDSWEWVRLGNISIINGGYAFKSTNFTEEGIRVIRISDFNEQGFVNNKIVRHKYDDTLAAYLLEPKNILLCMTGGTVGKSYFIEKLPEKMVTNQRVATIKFLQLIPEYGNLVILSPHIQKVISESKNSTNDNISMDTIKDFFVPLPSIEEQIKIVEQYNKLLPFIIEYDKAETKNNELNITFPDKLKKSILQDAVQGKLVPKNNNDEPASVLIEKIRKEKAQLIKNKKIKKDKNESYIFRRDNSHYEILNG